jgi:hypothetical protein
VGKSTVAGDWTSAATGGQLMKPLVTRPPACLLSHTQISADNSNPLWPPPGRSKCGGCPGHQAWAEGGPLGCRHPRPISANTHELERGAARHGRCLPNDTDKLTAAARGTRACALSAGSPPPSCTVARFPLHALAGCTS